MKQIIRLSLLCAAFAGCSAAFAGQGDEKYNFASDFNGKKEYTKKTEINIRFYSPQAVSIEQSTRNIDDIAIPDSVGDIISPIYIYNIRNTDRPILHSPTKLEEGDKKPKRHDKDILRHYNTRIKKLGIEEYLNLALKKSSISDQFDKSSKSYTSQECNYLNGDNFSSFIRSLMHNCKPFYYKESLTSCNQVERRIYHNNDSIFYSVSNGERVTINVILPDGSIITYHFPD